MYSVMFANSYEMEHCIELEQTIQSLILFFFFFIIMIFVALLVVAILVEFVVHSI